MSDKSQLLQDLIFLMGKLEKFWSDARGWAPESAAILLSQSRLDWLVALTCSLENWTSKDELHDGDLILAWANLGALTEGAMKLFLSVYVEDFLKHPPKNDKKGNPILPDQLSFEDLKVLLINKVGGFDQWKVFLNSVQHNRNAIHAFKHKDIGSQINFLDALEDFYQFLKEIHSKLPYPDDHYCL